MRLRHLFTEVTHLQDLIRESRRLVEMGITAPAPTDFAARIKAIPGWQNLDFLQSILSQVQRGRTLSDKQVAALEKFEKNAKRRGGEVPPDPHLQDRIMDAISKATRGIRGTCVARYAARPHGFIKSPGTGLLNKGYKYLRLSFDNGMDILDFGRVQVAPNGDRNYNWISGNSDYAPELRREFIDTAERAVAGLVPPGSKAEGTVVKD